MQRSFMNIHRTCFQVRKVRGIVTKLKNPEMVVSTTLIFRRLQRPYRFGVLWLHHLSAKSFTGQKVVSIVIISPKKLRQSVISWFKSCNKIASQPCPNCAQLNYQIAQFRVTFKSMSRNSIGQIMNVGQIIRYQLFNVGNLVIQLGTVEAQQGRAKSQDRQKK